MLAQKRLANGTQKNKKALPDTNAASTVKIKPQKTMLRIIIEWRSVTCELPEYIIQVIMASVCKNAKLARNTNVPNTKSMLPVINRETTPGFVYLITTNIMRIFNNAI